MDELSLDSMKTQINNLIVNRKITYKDCAAVAALTLIDIAETLRRIESNRPRPWEGGPG